MVDSKTPLKTGTKRSIEVSVALLLVILLTSMVSATEKTIPDFSSTTNPQYGIMWGGSSPSNAYELDFGSSEYETFYTQGADNWFYVETSSMGELVFELYDVQDKDQEDDLDLYVYDEDLNLMCYSYESGGSDEECSFSKTDSSHEKFYIYVYPYYIYKNALGAGFASCDIRTEATCDSDSDCGLYRKCVSDTCELKSCSEMGYSSCSSSQEGDLKCGGSGDRERMRCWEFIEDETYCWMGLGECLSDQYCDSGYCIDYECDLTDAYWSKDTAKEGETVTLTVEGDYCDDEDLDFEIWENDPMGDDYIDTIHDTFTGSSESASWTVIWVDDAAGTNPEFYFKAITEDDTKKSDDLDVVLKDCSDFGLTSCSVKGGYTKHSNTVFECKDQYPWWSFDEILCWEPISHKGDSDYCSVIACDHGESDCDYSSQCSNDLQCTGSLICLGGECGCCNSNEEWDKNSNSCKLEDGQSCSSASQCYGGNCVHGTCADTSWLPNDGYCDESEGESCSNSEGDCKKCDLDDCDFNSECHGGYCVHDLCWGNPWRAGDGFCDEDLGENPSNSPSDCFHNLIVLEVIDYPENVEQGENFQVRARLKNEGTYEGVLKLEAGIEPIEWNGGFTISSEEPPELGVMSYVPITKCCPGNGYYDAVEITLSPNEEEIVLFNIVAPTIHTVDDCDDDKRSAWGESHTLVVGLYEACGSGYVNYKAKNLNIAERSCNSNNDCWPGEWCDFNNGFPGICAISDCVDECFSEGSYACVGPEIKLCTNSDADTCLELTHVDYCDGNTICVPGENSCQTITPKTKVSIDYADINILVNKQVEDILKLRLEHNGNEIINLDYNPDFFELFECESSFTITSDTECIFAIKQGATGTYTLGVENGQKARVKIINNPQTLIITDRQKLLDRYDKDEVESLLQQAYRTASKENGIVYDLSDHLDGSPWEDFGDYDGGQHIVE